jgi:hypothetical protein
MSILSAKKTTISERGEEEKERHKAHLAVTCLT